MRTEHSTGPPTVRKMIAGGLAALALMLVFGIGWSKALAPTVPIGASRLEPTISEPIAKLIGPDIVAADGGTGYFTEVTNTASPNERYAAIANLANGGTESVNPAKINDPVSNIKEVTTSGATADATVTANRIPATTSVTRIANSALSTEANDVAWLGEPADLIVRI